MSELAFYWLLLAVAALEPNNTRPNKPKHAFSHPNILIKSPNNRHSWHINSIILIYLYIEASTVWFAMILANFSETF